VANAALGCPQEAPVNSRDKLCQLILHVGNHVPLIVTSRGEPPACDWRPRFARATLPDCGPNADVSSKSITFGKSREVKSGFCSVERSQMASYKNASYLVQNNGAAFDQDHGPGIPAPNAGIYRCMGCHREIGIALGHILPPQGHHSHTAAQGTIRWRLIVYADHNPK